jgi:hypothetical protein
MNNLSKNRNKAVDIIEKIIEPLVGRGIEGEEYYELEDEIVEILGGDK